jgi:hypothetical protein
MLSEREPTTGPKPPSDVEMAAVIAAVESLWPRPTIEEDVASTAETMWKFANRWWQGSNVLQRGRPRRPSSFN